MPTTRFRAGGREIELETRAGVHHDDANLPVYAALAPLVRAGDRVLDLGCGHGAFGVVAGVMGAREVVFADCDARAVELALANARRHGITRAVGRVGDFLAAVEDEAFDLVACNPPQTGGPPAFAETAPDRYGGVDGADFFARLAEGAARVAPAGDARIAFAHISRANPARVREAFASAGWTLAEHFATERTFQADDLERRCPGLAAYQLDLRARGLSEFEGPLDGRAGGTYRMRQVLFLATRRAR